MTFGNTSDDGKLKKACETFIFEALIYTGPEDTGPKAHVQKLANALDVHFNPAWTEAGGPGLITVTKPPVMTAGRVQHLAVLSDVIRKRVEAGLADLNHVSNCERKLVTLRCFSPQAQRPAETPEEQKAGDYLSAQRKVCISNLERKIESKRRRRAEKRKGRLGWLFG
ncbi:hypothetical protein ACHAPU_000671 [Fusarium lateritium]